MTAATDQVMADLCCGIYNYPDGNPVAWDAFELGSGTDVVCFGVKYTDDEDLIIFRGTADQAEWFDDFDFVSRPEHDINIGDVHAGFLVGMPEAWEKIKAVRRPGKLMRVGGHSLGAARASVCCALAIREGDTPAGRVVFGEPFPGYQSLCDILAPIPWQSSYCNGDAKGHDLITDVPFVTLLHPYRRPTPLTHLEVSPAGDDPWLVFRYHHAQLYRDAPGKRVAS